MIGPNFIKGGTATFTVTNPNGEHYTFRVIREVYSYAADGRTRIKDPNGGEVCFYVYVLTQGDKYVYMGMLNLQSDLDTEKFTNLRITAKSNFTHESKAYQVASWAFRVIWGQRFLPENYRIEHDGNCSRCGRTLTHPESLDSGLGPDCAGKVM